MYGVLFAGAVLAVLRILSIWLVLLAVTVVLLLHNRQALRRVNYSLLLTFVFFSMILLRRTVHKFHESLNLF